VNPRIEGQGQSDDNNALNAGHACGGGHPEMAKIVEIEIDRRERPQWRDLFKEIRSCYGFPPLGE